MRRHLSRWILLDLLVAAVGALLCVHVGRAAEPALEGYADEAAYRARIESIATSELATLESLGRTRGGRTIDLLAIGAGPRQRRDTRPAVLVVGSVHPPHLLGSELATRLARRLVEEAESEASVRRMLDRVTFYVIPRPGPDACAAFLRRPYFERAGNERPTDDDRDGRVDEDPPDDLNGDGLITMLRVEDASGAYVPHPEDDRVMVEADPQKQERGRYALYVEGRDDDRDEALNEDPAGGVAFNRNFTFRYPYFEPGAGPHQVSEVETRAVADFAFSHPNIAVVLCFTPEDNLVAPWKPDAEAEEARIKTTLLAADAPYFNRVAEAYRKILDRDDPPDAPEAKGSFAEWAYFHYGRWSFACRGWWPPEVETTQREDDDEDHDEDNEHDERGQHDLNALRWFAREKIDGFVDWRPIVHPDLPGRKVEVGGFKPFLRLNPPADRLEPLADRHWQYLRTLVERMPRVVIRQAKAEPLGRGVWRVTAVVRDGPPHRPAPPAANPARAAQGGLAGDRPCPDVASAIGRQRGQDGTKLADCRRRFEGGRPRVAASPGVEPLGGNDREAGRAGRAKRSTVGLVTTACLRDSCVKPRPVVADKHTELPRVPAHRRPRVAALQERIA